MERNIMGIDICEELFSLNNIRNMEIIDIYTGKRLGNIKDLVIDCEEQRIKSILLPKEKISWFGKEEFIEIPWCNIDKIGIDVILVHLNDQYDRITYEDENTNYKSFK